MRRPTKDYPQACTDFARVARAPGIHPDEFHFEYKTVFHLVKSASLKGSASMEDLHFPKS